MIQKPRTHWTHAGLTFVLTILAAGILLPLIRVQPRSVHNYFSGLSAWLRIGFAFFLCVVFTGAMFKLLSPRMGHFAHWKSYPPAWLAAFLAWIVVGFVDVFGGFDRDGYRATGLEWIGYGVGSLLVVGWYHGLWADILQHLWKPQKSQEVTSESIMLHDIEIAPWEEIEAWLQSDEPAHYDFLENRFVATRISRLIANGTRSVGIVGPFGAGKTSLVKWLTDHLQSIGDSGRRYYVCKHSCWGFETSASAIHEMLASAISKLSAEIDTFQIDSLPESYRQTFSAGGDWVETISKLVLRNPAPMEQFERLSNLLKDIGSRIVFIVEDLDRNETRNFEIQEVLAFLERLKPFRSLSFVLTGGPSSSSLIDYAKLCDHIEYLRTIQPNHSSRLIARVSARCLDTSVFTHVRLGNSSTNVEWNALTEGLRMDYEELSLPQAVASMLNTPRSLRHALGRTYSAWHILHGEIDFNHLLVVNILRFSAGECFQFLMRRWDCLCSRPSRHASMDQEGSNRVRQAIVDDWNRTILNVDWNPAAALQLMEFILPETQYWLLDGTQHGHSVPGRQSMSEERYWIRAVTEAIDDRDVRDQEVVRDIRSWLAASCADAELVGKLTALQRYADVWENLAASYFPGRPDQILLLCEHVLYRILCDQGSSACSRSQGFAHTWRFANRHVSLRPGNETWLQGRISEAAHVSIEMVNDLWHFYGSPGQYSILRPEDGEPVRRHVRDSLMRILTDGPSLVTKLSSHASATLYQLVFDPGNEHRQVLVEPQSWSWLGPIILEAMRSRNVVVAANCGVLLGARVSGRERMAVDAELLNTFFGDARIEVIEILDEMLNQLPQSDQELVSNVVGGAQVLFEGEPSEGDDSAD